MEDVNISKFRAQVVRAGSTPASPGFVESEGQNPVDPAGSGQNHLPVTIEAAATGLTITESQVLGGAGTVGQYIRGDGSLADFPASTGGGSSVSYYLNGSVSQGTIGAVAYRELSKAPVFGAGTDISINADGYIASFLTDANDPNLLEIPGGNWNLETYFSASSSGGNPSFYVELYKYNGTTFTLIASSQSAPELIAFGTNLTPYFSTLAVPTTTLAATDRLAIRYYVTHSGRTITLHTENNHLCQVITTFTTGLTALNGLTDQVQFLQVGTSGTDFNISSGSSTHTFNLPTASATNRGALSSADWTTFNNKQNALGFTPVPETRTLSINGTAFDLSANRSWTVGDMILADVQTVTGRKDFNTNTLQLVVNGTSQKTILTNSPIDSGSYSLAINALGFNASNNLYFSKGGNNNGIFAFSNAATRTYTLKDASGTLAFTSDIPANPVGGTGTTNYLPKFTGASTIGNSIVAESGNSIGIGTAAPQTYTNYSVLEINNTTGGAIRVKNTAATGLFELATNVNETYIKNVSNTPIWFGTNNIERLRLDGAGNLGLGVTPSAWSLSGLSTMQIRNAGFFGYFNETGITQNAYFNSGWKYIGTGNATEYLQVSGEHRFFTAASGTAGNAISFTQAMTLTSGGNLLVGTTTDNGARLQVSGTSTFSSTMTSEGTFFGKLNAVYQNSSTNILNVGTDQSMYGGTNSDGGVFVYGSNKLHLSTNSVRRLTVDGSGNVGIGTTSPESGWKLDVSGFVTMGGSAGNGRLYISSEGTTNGATYVQARNLSVGTPLRFFSSVNIFDSNVLIGTTTDNGARLQVSGSATIGGNLTVSSGNNLNMVTGDIHFQSNAGYGILSQNGNRLLSIQNGAFGVTGAATFSSLGTGTVYSNGGTLTNTNPSDFNLKENIAPINYGLGEILQLNAVTFNWKNDTINQGKQYGFIAQEVEKIMPDLVKKGEYLGLDKEAIFTTLVKAIQELKQEIDTLKN